MTGHDELLADLVGGDDRRSEDAAAQLAELGDLVVPSLSALLHSPINNERWWAVRTLAAMSEPRIDLLTEALADQSSEVRAAAALALVPHPSERAIPSLVRALADEDSLVSTLSINALVKIGAACVPWLLEAFPKADRRRRIQIMRALAALKDPRSIEIMLHGTEDESAMVNYWAREGLDSLGVSLVYLMPK